MTWMLYGLMTSLAFGVGDFLAGLATRRMSALTVVAHSKSIGALGIGAAALAWGGVPAGSDVLWGAVAGVALGLGSVAYYRLLASGSMGLTAAVTGVWTAVVPLAAGILLGERPAPIALAGVVLVVVAIGLISGTQHTQAADEGGGDVLPFRGVARPHDRTGALSPSRRLLLASLAGILFGLFFVAVDQANAGHALWPAVAAIAAAAGTLLTVALLQPSRRSRLRAPLSALALAGAVGACQTIATLAFVLGTRDGLLSIVSVAGALSPVPTAICAYFFLSQRLTVAQIVALVLALNGVVLMALGG